MAQVTDLRQRGTEDLERKENFYLVKSDIKKDKR